MICTSSILLVERIIRSSAYYKWHIFPYCPENSKVEAVGIYGVEGINNLKEQDGGKGPPYLDPF